MIPGSDLVLAIHDWGAEDGVPVMVLHGFTGSGEAMEPLLKRLPGLQTLALDLPGHGDSDSPDKLHYYSVDTMARLAVLTAESSGWSTFHLVGYSMGGRVALAIGCSEPERLRSLTLIGVSPGIADPRKRKLRRQADEALAQRITSDFERFVDEWMNNPLFAGQAALGKRHLAAARAQRLASNPDGLARSLRGGGTGAMTPLHDRLSACNVPTLLIAGGEDKKFCYIASEMRRSLPDARVHIIGRAGHAVHVEQPDATAATIAAFINERERNHGRTA